MRLSPMTSADDRLPVTEILLLWLAVAVALAFTYWRTLDESFASTDNVMRLVQIRGLLDGVPWFDPHEPRFAPPQGYDTHWSRLIDGGIAGLIMLFRQFVSPDLAERLARCVWPLLLSGPLVTAVIAIAVRLGGSGAGRATLLVAFPTLALFPLFRPGEIDHHNVQIMLSLVLVASAMWCQRPYLAAASGLAGGVLLCVGLEAAHVLIAVVAALGLLAVRDPAWCRPTREFGLALAASTIAMYLLVTPTALRFTPQCDALAVNSALAVAVGAMGLALVGALDGWAPRARLLALVAAGLAGLGVFAAFEPHCLRGPFGMIDRSVFPLWLDRVQEMQSVAQLFRAEGLDALVYVGFPVVSILSMILVIRAGLRTPLAWALVASFAISFLIMVVQIRMIVYVLWLGLPFIGVAAQYLADRAPQASLVRLMLALLASPPVVSLMITKVTAQVPKTERAQLEEHLSPCFRPDAFRTLATLPPGLVLGPLDLGPSILAHTPHQIVAAPYHRAYDAIRFNQEVMNGANEAARSRVVDRGVDYVVTCTDYHAASPVRTFLDALLTDTAGSWLRPVITPDGEHLKIWRVVR